MVQRNSGGAPSTEHILIWLGFAKQQWCVSGTKLHPQEPSESPHEPVKMLHQSSAGHQRLLDGVPVSMSMLGIAVYCVCSGP
eukprot:17933-Chlamydomonas_euryale.AAC.7